MKIKNFKIKNSTGFTLLETLAALSVLIFGILGPLTLAVYSIRSAKTSQYQLIAFNLAQEAMEYVRNRRDTNALAGAAEWLDGLGNCRGVNGCVIDVTTDNIQNCGSDCPKIKYNGANGLYNYASGVDTPFIREIKLQDVVADVEARVTVIISWTDKFGTKSFTAEENFFDWP